MRFSLRTLLLMFPAFLIAWVFAAFIYQVSRGMGHPKCEKDYLRLKRLHSAVSLMWAEVGQPIDIDKVNAWLAGKIPYSSPGYRELAEVLPPYQMNDLHDQPYRCVALDQIQQPVPDVRSSVRLGFYSLGKDGKSVTHGIDPDDFNSWEVLVHPYHLEQSNIQHSINVLAIVPLTFPFVLVFGWWVIGRRQASKQGKGQ